MCAERLEPGDRVLLYTDGVTEGRAADGTPFGLQRLADFIIRHSSALLPAPETMRRLNHAIVEYQNGRLRDDATAVLIEWQALLGSLGRGLLGAGVSGGQRPVGRFQVRADEPVELLQLAGLADEHVLSDLVEVLGSVDSTTVRLDDACVDHVQDTKVLLGACRPME